MAPLSSDFSNQVTKDTTKVQSRSVGAEPACSRSSKITESITALDSLAIQRSLTLLEDRYRELREIGEKRHQTWEHEKADLQQQLSNKDSALQDSLSCQADLQQQLSNKDSALQDSLSCQADLQQQLGETREEIELTLLQLHQVQEELEHYFLHSQKLASENQKLWLDIKTNWRVSRIMTSNKALVYLCKKALSATYST